MRRFLKLFAAAAVLVLSAVGFAFADIAPLPDDPVRRGMNPSVIVLICAVIVVVIILLVKKIRK
jgi:uncharacterized membrane protein (DUF106 family)